MKTTKNFQAKLTPGGRGKWGWTAAAALGSGLVWALLCQLVETQSARAVLAELLASSLAVWLTGLFLGLLVLALSLLLHSLFAGNLIAGGPALLLSFVNYYKMRITSTPLTLGDLALAGQVGDIAALNRASLSLSRNSVLALAGAAVWLVLCLLLSRPLRIPWGRSAAGGLGAVLAFGLLFGLGADAAFFRPLGVELSRAVTQATVSRTFGTPLGLWRALLSRTVRPMDQAVPDLDALLGDPEPVTKPAVQPNVILILSESFFDVTRLEGVSYTEDPVPEFRALKEEGVSGSFYTRSLGYGTCSIELDIFTALNTGLLSGDDLFYYAPETFSRVQALPALLARNGYSTTMLHMYDDSIYNRRSLFQYLGFETMYFGDDFMSFYPPAMEAQDCVAYMSSRLSGGVFSDDLMADGLIALYEQKSAGGPVFLYGSSMEGHQPYTDKYGPEDLTVSFTSSLTGTAEADLRAFSQCVHNASAALGKLTDYFRTCDEPTVIIFFGDHRPGLGQVEGDSVYSRLGLVPENSQDWDYADMAQLCSTDYLIWSNDPDYLPAAPGSTWDTSCSYLGAQLLELAGVELPTYWRLVDRLGQTRVADQVSYHLDRAGKLTGEVPEDDPDAQMLSALRFIIQDVLDHGGTAPE